jgi:hypothetical protein
VSKRVAISKKSRFEVFKRDSFTCQYCGATPPKVILNVDHIHPVAEGGDNNMDNLITSCEPCNLGKSANLLTDIPQSLKDKASQIAEREEQIKGYNEILKAKADRIDDESWQVAAALEGQDRVETYNRSSLLSIKQFLGSLPVSEVIEAADIAIAKFPWPTKKRFSYFCGVCWGKIREQNNG